MFLNRNSLNSLRNRSSLRVRLIALFVGIFGMNLIFFSFFLYRTFLKNHESEFDVALFNYSVDVAQAINVNLLGEITLTPNILSTSEKVFPFALGETLLQVRTLNGNSIARSNSLNERSLPMNRDDRDQLMAAKTVFKTIPAASLGMKRWRDTDFRLVMTSIERPGGTGLVLQVAVPMVLIEHERRGLLTFFAFSIPAVLCVAAFGGLYLSRKALEPFNAIVEKAREINPEQLSDRVPVPVERDEIHSLAVTLNALLSRIEATFRTQEAFVADASHQLKTPLAILRGEIDLMRSKPRSPEEVQDFLASASQEVTHLSRLVENLLLMARMDTGVACLARSRVRLDEIAIEITSRFERYARERGVRLVLKLDELASTTDGAFEVMGDADLFRILIENLVDNAIKYSSAEGVVTLTVRDLAAKVEARVQDQGPGIDAEALPKIFERFYRADDTRGVQGSGLGLAITKKIVDVHGGKIDLMSVIGRGTEFAVSFDKAGKSSV